MSEYANPLNNIKIASPCSADWNAMIGNERKRYCGECKLNVYNLSEMTKAQAENLIVESEGSLCVRFYRRADGTVLTKDCPVGWRALKRRVSKTTAAFASVLFGLLSGLSFNTFFRNSENFTPKTIESITVEEIRNEISPEMKALSEIQPIIDVEPPIAIAGGISNIEEFRKNAKKKRR